MEDEDSAPNRYVTYTADPVGTGTQCTGAISPHIREVLCFLKFAQ